MTFPQALNDLPAKWAHVFLSIERFLTRDLGLQCSNTHLILACSGGVDSTALLLFTLVMAPRWNAEVTVAHVDHGLRPESKDEAVHVSRLCEQNSLSLAATETDVLKHAESHSMGLEEAARNLRYDFFEQVRRERRADYIFLGHHLNDLAEDLILRLLRGTGWPGLAGMTAHDPGRCLVRPFLHTPKADLQDLLTELGIPWMEDDSNRDPRFLRNRVRSDILPLFLRENPNFLDAVRQLWLQGNVDREHWEREVHCLLSDMDTDGPPIVLPLDRLGKTTQAMRLRLYKRILDSMGPGQALAETLFQLDRNVMARTPSTFQFPGDKEVRIKEGDVIFGFKS